MHRKTSSREEVPDQGTFAVALPCVPKTLGVALARAPHEVISLVLSFEALKNKVLLKTDLEKVDSRFLHQ